MSTTPALVELLSHNHSHWSDATLQATESGRRRFQADVFGVSVHFGLYSIDGSKEWTQCIDKIPRDQYARRQAQFNPIGFDADAWIDEFVAWGATAFMVTAKHHDGFCLFRSRLTDFSSAHSPFGRDLIAELAAACHKRGVAFHLYYSLIDWHHLAMSSTAFEPASDFTGYIDYLEAQLGELLTGYGPIAGVLFDGWWPAARATADQGDVQRENRWPYGRIFDHIHRLQPACMVTNNHHVLPMPGEDYQVGEIDIPGENTTGFNCTECTDAPLMAWMTATTNGWSWQPERDDYLTPEVLASKYRRCRDRGAVFFQNVGPQGDGRLNPREISQQRAFAALRAQAAEVRS